MTKQNQDLSSNYSILNCLKPRFLFLLALSSVAKAYSPIHGVREYSVFNPVAQNPNGFFTCVGAYCGHTIDKKPVQEPGIGSTCINGAYGMVLCK